MCDPRPGARCSADTARELAIALTRLKEAQEASDRQSSDVESSRRLSLAEDNVRSKQAAYDSSPRGQSDLAHAITTSALPDAVDVDELRTRLCAGRVTRMEQRRALTRSRGGSAEDERRAALKVLNRLRHPDHSDALDPATDRIDAVGFFVVTPNRTIHTYSAEVARTAANQSSSRTFYDAQTGQHVTASNRYQEISL